MSAGEEALDLLRGAGAVLEGHFRYTSGRHGALYVEKFRLLEDPAATSAIWPPLTAASFRSRREPMSSWPARADYCRGTCATLV